MSKQIVQIDCNPLWKHEHGSAMAKAMADAMPGLVSKVFEYRTHKDGRKVKTGAFIEEIRVGGRNYTVSSMRRRAEGSHGERHKYTWEA